MFNLKYRIFPHLTPATLALMVMLALLALMFISLAVAPDVTGGGPFTTGEFHFSHLWAESTGGPTAIAGCNGGSGGGCGGG